MKEQKLIGTKSFVVTVIVLYLVLILLGVYAHLKWSAIDIFIYIWAALVVIDVLALVILSTYQLVAKKSNEKAQQYNKLRQKFKKVKEANENNSKRAAQTDHIEAEKESLKSEKASLERQLIVKERYIIAFRKIYTDVPLGSTRRYALECFRNCDGLDLFDPLSYRQNSRYATIIDQNSDRLYDILTAPIKDFSKDNTHAVRKELNILLGGGAGSVGSNAPVITRERTPLKKINKGDER